MSSAAWDAEAGVAKWTPEDANGAAAAASSGYPETKDGGAGEEEEDKSTVPNNNINWQGSVGGEGAPVPQSEQAVTQGPVSESSGMVVARAARDAIGVTGGAFPSGGGPSASAPPNGRRHTMAFEIARVERSGKTVPRPAAHKAQRVWELSRPRYVATAESGSWGGRRLRVPPGKESRDAVAYGVWSTSWAQMGDFGLDVGMYFVTISQLIGASLVYAALCIVAMLHFSSERYSAAQVRG